MIHYARGPRILEGPQRFDCLTKCCRCLGCGIWAKPPLQVLACAVVAAAVMGPCSPVGRGRVREARPAGAHRSSGLGTRRAARQGPGVHAYHRAVALHASGHHEAPDRCSSSTLRFEGPETCNLRADEAWRSLEGRRR